MHWLVSGRLERWKSWLLIVAAMLFAGATGKFLGTYLGSLFALGGEATEYVTAACFFGVLAAGAWADDRFERWRFLRSGKL
jgi:hypothetical protein